MEGYLSRMGGYQVARGRATLAVQLPMCAILEHSATVFIASYRNLVQQCKVDYYIMAKRWAQTTLYHP